MAVTKKGWVGVMAVDPGGTTGVAWGVHNVRRKGIKEVLASGRRYGTAEATGGEPYQAAKIVEIWNWFAGMCGRHRIPCTLVFEDFVLRPRTSGASAARSGLTPVRITELVRGMLIAQAGMLREGVAGDGLGEPGFIFACDIGADQIVLQQPSNAKSFATNDRLKRWGVYEKGSDHKRDAMRHLALYLVGVEE